MQRGNFRYWNKVIYLFFLISSFVVGNVVIFSLSYQKVYSENLDQSGYTINKGLLYDIAFGKNNNDTRSHTVFIKSAPANKQISTQTSFEPSSLFIHKGDTVTWINSDNLNHSINSLAFNSDILWPSGSNKGPFSFNHTFNRVGTFIYIDRFHPGVGGIVYVDVPTSQRELVSTTGSFVNVKIEMPQNAAYKNNYGPFFIPAGATIPPGTRLTWTNKDYVAHTATSGDGSTFDTKTILPGESLSITLNSKGVFPYFCKIHPWMVGTVTVS